MRAAPAATPHSALPLRRASLEFLLHSGQQPDILQVHDWHSAAVPLLFWELYHGSGLHKPRIVM